MNNEKQTDDRENSFNMKKQLLKTPHPKIFSLGKNSEEENENAATTTRFNFDKTTKDNSFLTSQFANSIEETEKPIKMKKVFYKQENVSFPKFSKISDYFVNFKMIRSENERRRSSEERHVKEEGKQSAVSYNIKEESTESKSSISPNYANFTFNMTPSFGASQMLEQIGKEEPLHPLLPTSMKDNEVFKHSLVNNLRDNKMNSDTHKFVTDRKRKISELNTNLQFDFSVFKRRKSNSAKRVYQSSLPLFGEDNRPTFFEFYRDEDLGITKEWTTQITDQTADNDDETDEETQVQGILESHYSIQQAIQEFAEEKDVCLWNKMIIKRK